MRIRLPGSGELDRIARMNVQLQREEGSEPMAVEDALARLRDWLAGEYRCVVFSEGGTLAGYALFRPTDPQAEGNPGGIYLRQFYIVPELRGRGLGTRAFALLRTEVLPPGGYLTLEVTVHNRAGQAFWTKLGFRLHSMRYELPATTRN